MAASGSQRTIRETSKDVKATRPVENNINYVSGLIITCGPQEMEAHMGTDNAKHRQGQPL